MSETNDVERLTAERENATIHATAARNGLALAELRERNLRAENERLKAELEHERIENVTLACNNVRLRGEVDRERTAHEQMRRQLLEIGMALEAAPLPLRLKVHGAETKAILYLATCARNDDAVHACRHQGDLEEAVAEGARLKAEVDELRRKLKPATMPSDKPADPARGVAPNRQGHRPGYGMQELHDLHQAALRAVRLEKDGRLCWCGACFTTGEGLQGEDCQRLQEAGYAAQRAYLGEEAKPAGESRLEALENRLADVEVRLVARLDRLADWQRRDVEAAAAVIEHLAKRLAERVKALEAQAEPKSPTLYRIQYGGDRVGMDWLFAPTDHWPTAKYRYDGIPGSWLEVSDDNGRTWQRCDEKGEVAE